MSHNLGGENIKRIYLDLFDIVTIGNIVLFLCFQVTQITVIHSITQTVLTCYTTTFSWNIRLPSILPSVSCGSTMRWLVTNPATFSVLIWHFGCGFCGHRSCWLSCNRHRLSILPYCRSIDPLTAIFNSVIETDYIPMHITCMNNIVIKCYIVCHSVFWGDSIACYVLWQNFMSVFLCINHSNYCWFNNVRYFRGK